MCAQIAENGFGFDFFGAISQIWQWISQSHCMSNRWWNLVLFCSIKTRELSKQWVHTFTKQSKKVQTNVCQKAADSCFLGQKKSAYGGINAMRDHNNVRSVLQNTKITTQFNSEQKVWTADIRCSAPSWQCVSTYSSSHSSAAGAFQRSCLNTLLTAMVSLQATTTSLLIPTWRTGWHHSTINNKRSWWNVSKCGWTQRR
jgi:hypothetical protein